MNLSPKRGLFRRRDEPNVYRGREMPAPMIIKPAELEKLLAQGFKKVEIARHLGVSSTAVTKAIR